MKNHHILFIIVGLCSMFLLSCKTTKDKQNLKEKIEGTTKKKGEKFEISTPNSCLMPSFRGHG